MAIIDSLIRKRRLVRAQRAQELAAALSVRENSARECSVAGHEHEEILRYLWLQLETAGELSVQLLAAARREEAHRKQRLASFLAAHRIDCENVARLEALIARLDKDLEKLEERRLERCRLFAGERASQEALRLDEWVLGRHGRGALP
jgi:hypothetical protein